MCGGGGGGERICSTSQQSAGVSGEGRICSTSQRSAGVWLGGGICSTSQRSAGVSGGGGDLLNISGLLVCRGGGGGDLLNISAVCWCVWGGGICSTSQRSAGVPGRGGGGSAQHFSGLLVCLGRGGGVGGGDLLSSGQGRLSVCLTVRVVCRYNGMAQVCPQHQWAGRLVTWSVCCQGVAPFHFGERVHAWQASLK